MKQVSESGSCARSASAAPILCACQDMTTVHCWEISGSRRRFARRCAGCRLSGFAAGATCDQCNEQADQQHNVGAVVPTKVYLTLRLSYQRPAKYNLTNITKMLLTHCQTTVSPVGATLSYKVFPVQDKNGGLTAVSNEPLSNMGNQPDVKIVLVLPRITLLPNTKCIRLTSYLNDP